MTKGEKGPSLKYTLTGIIGLLTVADGIMLIFNHSS